MHAAFNLAMISRRDLLRQAGAGFGWIGLAGALQSAGLLAAAETRPARLAAKARRVIFLFMNGGPSHVDTFDPKPALVKHEGQKPEGRDAKLGFMPSPFKFQPHGEGGIVMSELFPRLSACADDLCVIRSLHTDTPNHEPGLLLMHSGHQQPTRPSLGSWVSYGLGSLNENLPTFVVLTPGQPVVGPQLWSSSFLPGNHQAMAVNTSDLSIEKLVPFLPAASRNERQQREQIDLLQALNQLHLRERREDAALETQIRTLETDRKSTRLNSSH